MWHRWIKAHDDTIRPVVACLPEMAERLTFH
jgi:hypothetical protein